MTPESEFLLDLLACATDGAEKRREPEKQTALKAIVDALAERLDEIGAQ